MIKCCRGSSLIYAVDSVESRRGEVLKVVTGGGGVPRMLLIVKGLMVRVFSVADGRPVALNYFTTFALIMRE
jgi:hypothetical protein